MKVAKPLHSSQKQQENVGLALLARGEENATYLMLDPQFTLSLRFKNRLVA
jgi:hypothetical protein